MQGTKTDTAIRVTIAVILCGVVAASLARVCLLEPKPSLALQHAHAGEDSLVNTGKKLFDTNCAGCHAIDTTEGKYAPGLKGLSKTGKLPTSGRPATAEHIRDQLKKPFKTMPPFDKLSDQEVQSLAAYVLTL
jgi:mono/diheme cytochrome c family protein